MKIKSIFVISILLSLVIGFILESGLGYFTGNDQGNPFYAYSVMSIFALGFFSKPSDEIA